MFISRTYDAAGKLISGLLLTAYATTLDAFLYRILYLKSERKEP